MKEIFGSLQCFCDLVGFSFIELEFRKRLILKRKFYLDFFKFIMDGMIEVCIKGGIEVCYVVVFCVCILLGVLDEFSQGKGLSEGQV